MVNDSRYIRPALLFLLSWQTAQSPRTTCEAVGMFMAAAPAKDLWILDFTTEAFCVTIVWPRAVAYSGPKNHDSHRCDSIWRDFLHWMFRRNFRYFLEILGGSSY